MKYESIKLLFQQDKYVQFTSVISLMVFSYCFYQLSTGLTSNLNREPHRSIYEIHSGTVTVRGEIYSGKSWMLSKCNTPLGHCWVPIEVQK